MQPPLNRAHSTSVAPALFIPSLMSSSSSNSNGRGHPIDAPLIHIIYARQGNTALVMRIMHASPEEEQVAVANLMEQRDLTQVRCTCDLFASTRST